MSFSASYTTVNVRHLAHPQDVNTVSTDALRENTGHFAVNNSAPQFAGCTAATPNAASCFPTSLTSAAFEVSLPTASNANYTVVIPGLIAVNNATGQRIVSPIAADYFRRLETQLLFCCVCNGRRRTKAIFDSQLAGSVRTPRANKSLL